jgi:uncharacterized repeat protein (TIGR01451 family)
MFTFTIAVTNYGPSVSSNVLVNDTLPFGVALVSTNVLPGTTLNRSGTQLIWNIGTLNTGAGSQLAFTLQPAVVGNYINYAIVSADTADPNPDDDSASIAFSAVSPFGSPLLSGFLSNTNVTFNVTGGPGQIIEIDASTNLMSWLPIYTNTGTFIFTDTNTTIYPLRFYRAVGLP